MLEIQDIKDILDGTRKGKKSEAADAITHQDSLRMHSELTVTNRNRRAITMFLDGFVAKLLPKDKLYTFKHLFRFPVRTVSLTKRIYTALYKLFDGRNPVFRYEFNSPEHEEDWQSYKNKELRVLHTWKTKGFDCMKTCINSFVVVDLPEEQGEGALPAPYFYFLDPVDAIDFEPLDDNYEAIDWIIFKCSDGRIAVFDDEYYRVFETSKGTNQIDWSKECREVQHGLEYCPVRFFWSTPISYNQPAVKVSPLTAVLSALDMLLFYIIGNEHLNTYARYPVYMTYATDCDYESADGRTHCEDGYLKDRSGWYLMEHGAPAKCPVCSEKRLEGAGSLVEVDPPSPANDHTDLRDPVTVLTIDRTSLDYNNEDNNARASEIYMTVTGFQSEVLNDQAVNEKQVLGMFDSLEAALQEPQRNFEAVMKWVDETLCLLRYGRESFVSASISLGTEHYIFTPAQYMDMYTKAKAANMSTGVLDMLENLYYQTEYRNNPEQLQRHLTLLNLDPFRHKSNAEVAIMYDKNQISYEEYMLKVNFSTLLMRFERENAAVTEFGQGISFERRVENIQAQLLAYAAEYKPEVISEPEEQPEGELQE